MKNKSFIIPIYLVSALFVIIMLFAAKSFFYRDKEPYVLEVYRHSIELKYYDSKSALADSIDRYIDEIAPKSCMNGIAFVEASETYNLDVFFMMAQCQNESLFSTEGLARKNNSAFGVKAYDGKSDKHMDKYSHPDLSISDYAKLINSKYIKQGKSEYDLMDKFVDINGKRYASDINYENKIYSIYKKLSDRFGETYKEFLKFKTLSGK